jgi:hypothetical protein
MILMSISTRTRIQKLYVAAATSVFAAPLDIKMGSGPQPSSSTRKALPLLQTEAERWSPTRTTTSFD